MIIMAIDGIRWLIRESWDHWIIQSILMLFGFFMLVGMCVSLVERMRRS
jgi:hypothetical protein